MNQVKWLAAVLAAAAVVVLNGCGRGSAPDTDNGGNVFKREEAQRLQVTTTLFPYYDFVRQIAGDQVRLKLVVPAGMDSHSFEPTPADMIAIQDSDIFFYNGGEMELWVEAALESMEAGEIRAVSMMEYVDVLEEELVEGMEEEEDHHDHDHHHFAYEPGQVREIEYDEHIWTSPANAIKIVEAISQVLIQEDPEHEALYLENTKRYVKELRELDQAFFRVSQNRKRDMIIVGDKFPFRYLAERYQLSYRAAFSGCSGDTEPSARTIAYLIEQVRKEALPAVYYLELSSHRVAEIIGEETGARPLLLHSCHNVTKKEFEVGVTYLQLMKQNVKNLEIGIME